jgi:uncharacterized protein YkwD
LMITLCCWAQVNDPEIQAEFLQQANSWRASVGVPDLTTNWDIAAYAQYYSEVISLKRHRHSQLKQSYD